MNLLILSCIVCLCWKSGIVQSCPVGFEQEPGSGRCFSAVAGSLSWSAAYSSCNALGATLARINSGNISLFISNTVLTNKTGNVFWIGLSDLAVEGVFRWLTNEFPMWSHWDAGFPLYSSSSNCVWVNKSNSLVWRDANCSELHGFICEYIADTAAIPTDPVLTGECLKAQPVVANILAPCWKIFVTSRTWDESKAYCESTFGALVTPTAGNIQTVINETSARNLDAYWLGLSTQTTDGNLRMQTTTCVPSWTNWANPFYNAGGKCVLGNSTIGHHWKMTKCNELHSFLCDYQLGLNCSLPPALPPSTVLLALDTSTYPFMVAYYGCQSGYNLTSGQSYNFIVCDNCGEWTPLNSYYCSANPTAVPSTSTKKTATTTFSITTPLKASAAVTTVSVLTTRTSQYLTTVVSSTTQSPKPETTSRDSTSTSATAAVTTVQSTFQSTVQNTTQSSPQTTAQTTTQSTPETFEHTTTQSAPQTSEQTTAQSTPQTLEQTTTQSTPQTLKQTTTQSTPQTLKQTTTQSTPQTLKQTTAQSTPQTLEQTTAQSTPQTLEQTTAQSTPQTLEQTTTQSTPQTLKQTTTQSTPQTLKQTTTQSTPQTLKQTTAQSTPQTLEQTTAQSTPQTLEQTTAQSTPQTLEQTTTQSTPQTLKQTTTQSTPQTLEQTTAQSTPQTLKQTTTQSTPQTLKQTTTQSTPQTLEQTTTQSTPQTLEQTTAQSTPQTLEQTTTQSTPQTLEQTTAQSTLQTLKQTITLSTLQSFEQTTAQSTSKTMEPTITQGASLTVKQVTIQGTSQTSEQTTTKSLSQIFEQTTSQNTPQTFEQTATQGTPQAMEPTIAPSSSQTLEQTTAKSSSQTFEQTTAKNTMQTFEQTTTQNTMQTFEQTTTQSAEQTMAEVATTGLKNDEITVDDAQTSATTCHVPLEKTTVLENDCMKLLTSMGIGIEMSTTETDATVSSSTDIDVSDATESFTTTGFVRTRCNVLPEFSSMISNYSDCNIGSVVKFTCRDDLTFADLTHVKLAHCNESGRWDPPIEYCAKSITKTFRAETQPLEAPGSVGIGSVALIICVLEMVGLLVLDLDLYFKNLQLLYRNLCHGRKAVQQNRANC